MTVAFDDAQVELTTLTVNTKKKTENNIPHPTRKRNNINQPQIRNVDFIYLSGCR
jgi:hypothetical protein